MLGINSNKNKTTDISSVNLIGEGTKIVGDINSDSGSSGRCPRA